MLLLLTFCLLGWFFLGAWNSTKIDPKSIKTHVNIPGLPSSPRNFWHFVANALKGDVMSTGRKRLPRVAGDPRSAERLGTSCMRWWMVYLPNPCFVGECLNKTQSTVDLPSPQGHPDFFQVSSVRFQICFIFIPNLGEDEPMFGEHIFQPGLVQPPTSEFYIHVLLWKKYWR